MDDRHREIEIEEANLQIKNQMLKKPSKKIYLKRRNDVVKQRKRGFNLEQKRHIIKTINPVELDFCSSGLGLYSNS